VGETGPWLELSPVELVKEMPLAGHGISLVPEIAVRRELGAGDLVRQAASAGPLPTREIALLRRRRAAPNPAAEALARAVTASLRKVVQIP